MSDWVQVTLNEALQAYLKGRTVKVVDLSADVIMPLAEVLERFQQGAVMYMDGEVEPIVESDPEKLNQEIEELRDKLQRLTEEYGDLSTKYAELDAAYQIAKHPAPPAQIREVLAEAIEEDLADQDPDRKDPTASAALYGGDGLSHVKDPKPVVKPKKNRNKSVAQVEEEYRKRKIKDTGRLKALRDAGWKLAELADEFRCCPQTVANELKKLKEQEAQEAGA